MSRMETDCKPYLLSMIEGHGRTYYDEGQKRIASWAVKTALMAGSRFQPPTPTSFYADFCDTKIPSDGTRVWIGATNRQYAHYIDHRPLRVHSDDGVVPDSENGYATVLGCAHLALYIFARESSKPPIQDFGGKFGGAFRQVWPIEGPATYPPDVILSYDDLDAVADTVGTFG